ncbi:hypothetical protein FOA39_03680 [Streptococcus cristatus]|nr:hypothetical protein [Streptococcus cristatus]
MSRSSWAAAPKRAFVVPVTFACDGRSAAAGAPTGFLTVIAGRAAEAAGAAGVAGVDGAAGVAGVAGVDGAAGVAGVAGVDGAAGVAELVV